MSFSTISKNLVATIDYLERGYNWIRGFREGEPNLATRTTDLVVRHTGSALAASMPKTTLAVSGARYLEPKVHQVIYGNAASTPESRAAIGATLFALLGCLFYSLSGNETFDYLLIAMTAVYFGKLLYKSPDISTALTGLLFTLFFYLMPGSMSENIMELSAAVVGSKEALRLGGYEPLPPHFNGRALRTYAADRAISVITNSIPYGVPLRMVIGEIVFREKVQAAIALLPSGEQARDIRRSLAARLLEPNIDGAIGANIAIFVAPYFPKTAISLYVAKYAQELMSEETEDPIQWALAAFIASEGLLWIASGTIPTDWLILLSASVLAAKAGRRLVGYDPTFRSHWLDSFEARTARCMLLDRSISVITDNTPVVGPSLRLLAGFVCYNALPIFKTVKFFRTHPLAGEREAYDEFNPAALLQQWAFQPDGPSKIQMMMKKVPIPGPLRNWLTSFIDNGIEGAALTNTVARSFNSFVGLLKSPEIMPLITAYMAAPNKQATKQALENALYKKITEGKTFTQGVKTYASTYANPFITAPQILSVMESLETSMIGMPVSNNSNYGELIEILARGFNTLFMKTLSLRGTITPPLANQEIKDFYMNLSDLFSLYYFNTAHQKTREFVQDTTRWASGQLLDRGGYITQYFTQRGNLTTWAKEAEEFIK